MAIIWQTTVNQVTYQVRNAGQTLRLYTNGVFHSQYHPKRYLTSTIWDCLSLPAVVHHHQHAIQHAVVLGVGGGTVLHQLQAFVQPKKLTGVDIDPQHLIIAKRFFNLNYNHLSLHQADAIQWMQQRNNLRADLIIDDLYGESQGQPVRAALPSATWLKTLCRHLTPSGVLVINFAFPKEWRDSQLLQSDIIQQRFLSAFRLTSEHYDNTIVALFPYQLSRQQFLAAISTNKLLSQKCYSRWLRYSVSKIRW